MGIKEKYALYEKIANEIEAGLSTEDAVAKFNLSRATIYKICAEWGVYLRDRIGAGQVWPGIQERNKSILARFDAGETLEAIGESLGITRERVRQITNKNNRTPRHIQSRERDEEILTALLGGEQMTAKEAAEYVGLTVAKVHSLNGRHGHPVEFKKDRIIDHAQFADMAAKVMDGMSMREAAGNDHRIASALHRYCMEHGIKSVHGRWHDRALRRSIVIAMRKKGSSWEDIADAVSRAENKVIEPGSLVTWASQNVREVFKLRGKMGRQQKAIHIAKPKTEAEVAKADSLREAIKLNYGSGVTAQQLATQFGVTRNSVLGLTFRMRQKGELPQKAQQ